jgi:transposase-like protein
VDNDALDKLSGIIRGDTDILGLNFVNGKVKFEFEHTEKDEASVKAVRGRAQKSAAYYDVTYSRIKNEMKVGKVEGYIGELDNFWRFAAERLIGYKGTEQKYFILFLKKLEFRYNHRNDILFNEIVAKLS